MLPKKKTHTHTHPASAPIDIYGKIANENGASGGGAHRHPMPHNLTKINDAFLQNSHFRI
jgi:hypothetical protein